jgi:hypothetical protein
MNLNHFYHYYKSKSGGVSNLLKASEDFTSSLDWLKKPDTDAPTITGGVTDPNGGTDAQRVNFTANRQSRVQQSVTLSASTQYTFSVYARVNTGTDQFRLRNVTLSAAEAKTATTSWTRFEYTFTTTTGGVYELSIQNTENVAANIEFFGAMLNVGSSANDYVKVDPSTGGSAPTPAYSGFGDVFGGATAYYSLRQFTEAETLNAIRVRRSSDDTEQDIGFDANGDLDSTALLAFVNTEHTIADEDFSSSTGWTLGTGVSITGGVMTANTSGTIVSYKNFGDTGAQQVRVTFTISNYVSGSVRYMNFAVSTTGTPRTANGTYTEVLTLQEGGNANHGLQMFDTFVGDIDDFEIVQLTADGAVTTFYDQTGNGNDATNSTESEQPLVVSGGSVLVDGNGKAKIQATASTQYLTATRIDPNPLYSFYALEKGTSTGAFSGFTGQWTNSYAIFFGSTRASVFDTLGTRHNVARGTTMTSGNRYLISAVFDNDIEIYQDGTLEGSVSAVGDLRFSDTSQKLRFFSYSANNSDPDSCLQEIIFFNSDQSTNRTGMEGNINDHFDIYP